MCVTQHGKISRSGSVSTLTSLTTSSSVAVVVEDVVVEDHDVVVVSDGDEDEGVAKKECEFEGNDGAAKRQSNKRKPPKEKGAKRRLKRPEVVEVLSGLLRTLAGKVVNSDKVVSMFIDAIRAKEDATRKPEPAKLTVRNLKCKSGPEDHRDHS